MTPAPDARVRELAARWAAFLVAVHGIPSRWRAWLPHLTAADEGVLDALLRDALTELARGGGPVHPNSSPSDQEETTP
jgi:hypothetical protein